MTAIQILRGGLGILSMLGAPMALVAPAWAQATAPTPTPTPTVPPASGEAGGGALFVVLMIALFAVIGIGVKLYDLSRKRSDEAMHLQARIADALMLDPALATLPVAATAHAPLWRGSPLTIEVTGHVPSNALREVAMKAVLAEASRAGLEFRIEDKLTVTPQPLRRVA